MRKNKLCVHIGEENFGSKGIGRKVGKENFDSKGMGPEVGLPEFDFRNALGGIGDPGGWVTIDCADGSTRICSWGTANCNNNSATYCKDPSGRATSLAESTTQPHKDRVRAASSSSGCGYDVLYNLTTSPTWRPGHGTTPICETACPAHCTLKSKCKPTSAPSNGIKPTNLTPKGIADPKGCCGRASKFKCNYNAGSKKCDEVCPSHCILSEHCNRQYNRQCPSSCTGDLACWVQKQGHCFRNQRATRRKCAAHGGVWCGWP